jgi:hypothetical protein
VALRHAFLDSEMIRGDALQLVQAAGKADGGVGHAVRDVAFKFFGTIAAELEALSTLADLKPAQRANIVSSLSFAFQNSCNSLKAAGCCALPKGLMDRLGERSDDPAFAKGILSQINVMVNTGAPGASSVSVGPAPKPVEVPAETSHNIH